MLRSTPKVVILCGGKGTRMREHTELMPKPMVAVGEMPIIWHIMKNYYHQGFNDFVLCLGYKGQAIRNFFINYVQNHDDITVHPTGILRKGNPLEDWKVTLVDTGEESNTALRLGKVVHHLQEGDIFLLTYGDGVANVDINKLIEFHKQQGTLATITGVRARSKYGKVKINEKNLVNSFEEKPILDDWINGGFMVFNKEFLTHPLLKENIPLEKVLETLASMNQLSLYKHDGFWHCMDTSQDQDSLNNILKTNPAWKIW